MTAPTCPQDDAPSPGPNRGSSSYKETTTTHDVTPPTFTTGEVDSQTATSVDITVELTEAGSVYVVAIIDGADIPTAAQVRALTGASGEYVPSKATTGISANSEVTITVEGLVSETTYTIVMTCEDSASPSNLRMDRITESFTTLDNTPPSFAPGYPSVTSVSGEGSSTGVVSASMGAQLDEQGTVYFMLVPKGEGGNPTSAQVKAGTSAGATNAYVCGNVDVSDATTVWSTVVTHDQSCETSGPDCSSCDLIHDHTWYDLFFVAEDDDGNIQATPTMVEWYAPDATPPVESVWSTGTITPTSIDIDVTLDEAATIFYVATESSTAPTTAQIKLGHDTSSDPAVSAGTFGVLASTSTTHTVTGLVHGTTYHIHAVLEDASGNSKVVSESASSLDNVAPQFTDVGATSYPRVSARAAAGDDITFEVVLDEPGSVHYVVVEKGTAPAPTAANVAAGEDGSGNAPSAANGAEGSITVGTALSAVAETTLAALDDRTDYDVYFVAEDASGNLQGEPTLVETYTLDNTPPTLTALKYGTLKATGYTTSDDTTPVAETDIDLRVALSEPGTVHYAVYSVATTVTLTDIDAEANLLASGTVDVPIADTVVSTLVSPGQTTAYTYLSAQDSSHGGVWIDSAVTLPATIWKASFTSSSDIGLRVEASRSSVYVWYVVLAAGSDEPSPAQVYAGNDATDTAALASGDGQVDGYSSGIDYASFSGLETDLSEKGVYDIYVIASDSATPTSSQYSQIVSAFTSVVAPDNSAPLFDPGYPSVASVYSNSLQVEVQLDEPATVHYAVMLSSDTAPTVSEVKAATAPTGAALFKSGSIDVVSAGVLFKVSYRWRACARCHCRRRAGVRAPPRTAAQLVAAG